MKDIYVRTPESNQRLVDFDVEIRNSFKLPVITEDNQDSQEENCFGFKDGVLVYVTLDDDLNPVYNLVGGGSDVVRIDLDFTDLGGSITIDYTTLTANIPEPVLEFWNTEEISSGVIKETNIHGVSITKTRTDGVITEIVLDGIFGTGFIRILPAPSSTPA